VDGDAGSPHAVGVMNDINTVRRNAELANNAFIEALIDHKDLVPQVDRVCPASGRQHRNPCDEYFDITYSSKFSPKKFTALLKVYPAASVLVPLASAAGRALAELLSACEAEKARKAAAKAARDAKASYKEAHGARPAVKPNCNAAGNFDVLSVTLAETRAAFVAHCVPLAVEAALTRFEANRAKLLAAREEYNRAYGAKQTFDRLKATQDATSAAKAEFDAYVAKLAVKIEARITATVSLTGSLWNGSLLTVDTDAGRQSYNTSLKRNARYGHNAANGHFTGYYQWPTVRVA